MEPDKHGFSITQTKSAWEPLARYSGGSKWQGVIKFEVSNWLSTVRDLSIPEGILIGRYAKFQGSRQEFFNPYWLVHLTYVKEWDHTDDDFIKWHIWIGMYDPKAPGNFRVLVNPDEKVDGKYAFYGKMVLKKTVVNPKEVQWYWNPWSTRLYYYYRIGVDWLESIFPDWLWVPLDQWDNIMNDGDWYSHVIYFNHIEWEIFSLTKRFVILQWWETFTCHKDFERQEGIWIFSIQQNHKDRMSAIWAYYAILDGKYYYIGFPKKKGKYLDGSMSYWGWSVYGFDGNIILEAIKNWELQEESLPLDIESRIAKQRSLIQSVEDLLK